MSPAIRRSFILVPVALFARPWRDNRREPSFLVPRPRRLREAKRVIGTRMAFLFLANVGRKKENACCQVRTVDTSVRPLVPNET